MKRSELSAEDPFLWKRYSHDDKLWQLTRGREENSTKEILPSSSSLGFSMHAGVYWMSPLNIGSIAFFYALFISLGWGWDPGDQWGEHQGHEARPRHWTDQKRWPKSPPGPKEGGRLCARIWWVNLREHPLLPCLHPLRSSPMGVGNTTTSSFLRTGPLFWPPPGWWAFHSLLLPPLASVHWASLGDYGKCGFWVVVVAHAFRHTSQE